MSTITKERLQRLIRAIDSENYDEEEIVGWVNSNEIMELARIALASLEAKPVAWIIQGGNYDTPLHISSNKDYAESFPDREVTPLYTTAPAIKDHQIRELINELRDIAVEYHGTQQLRERISRTVRAALLAPVVPDGYALVPIEPTEKMLNAWLSEVANWRGHVAGYKSMLCAAPQPGDVSKK